MSRRLSSPAEHSVDRRKFIQATGLGVAGLALGGTGLVRQLSGAAADGPEMKAEALVQELYRGLQPEQRKAVCFAWDYMDPERGLLRTRVANNWQITEPEVNGEFYSADQQQLIRQIFEAIIRPDWHERIDKQLQDDAGGWGNHQSIAIFGTPGEGPFEFVLTGRHMTLRCDGNSTPSVAFGGPIFYGHAASGFNESAGHPGNVYWPQALAANSVYDMLSEKQRQEALVDALPDENQVQFGGAEGKRPGIAVRDLTSDQKDHVALVLKKLVEPYRQADQAEVKQCLEAMGGLDACRLAFFKEGDIGSDGVWDNWRLEGPAFVWHFRGAPHVHVWVNVADDPSVKLNAAG
jgi:hypothetical protein